MNKAQSAWRTAPRPDAWSAPASGLTRARKASIREGSRKAGERWAEWLALASGIIIPAFYAPLLYLPLTGAPVTGLRFGTYIVVAALILWLVPAPARDGPRAGRGARLVPLEICLVLYFTLFSISSIIGALNDPALHWPTMFGGLFTEAAVALAALRLGAEERSARTMQFMKGLQLGLLILLLALVSKGAIGANLLKRTAFLTFEGMDRNGVMVLSSAVLCASLTGLLVRRRQVLDVVGVLAASYLIVFSASKGAWVSAGGVVLLFAVLSLARGWWGRLLAGALAAAAALPVVLPRVQTYLNFYLHRSDSASLSGRTDLWAFGLGRLHERDAYLLGFGFNAAAGAAPKATYVFHLHNEFINSLYSGGVLGVLVVSSLLLAFLVGSSLQTWREAKAADRAHGLAAETVFCSMVGVFVVTRLLTDVSLSASIDILPIFLFCCGVVAGRRRESSFAAAARVPWRTTGVRLQRPQRAAPAAAAQVWRRKRR